MKVNFSTVAAGLGMLLSVFLVGQARAQSDTLSVAAVGHATSTQTIDENVPETAPVSTGFDGLPGTFTLSGNTLVWVEPAGEIDAGKISDIFTATTTPGAGGTTNVRVSITSDTNGTTLAAPTGTVVTVAEPNTLANITSQLFSASPAGFSVTASSDLGEPAPPPTGVVPEPGSLALFIPGLFGLAFLKRRRKNSAV